VLIGLVAGLGLLTAAVVLLVTGVGADPAPVTVPAAAETASGVPVPALAEAPEKPDREQRPPRLTLVTCGGAFDPVARAYQDNVVVTAEPLLG
jgi:hypothetical protein